MNNNNYIYLEKAFNLPGFRSSGLIYNIALYILHLIKKNPDALKMVKDGDGPDISSLITHVKTTYDKVDNLITTLNDIGLPPLPGKRVRPIEFQNLTDKKLATSFYVKIIPVHYIFMTFLVENEYIDDIFKDDLKKIYNALSQIYANPELFGEEKSKENEVIKALISLDADGKRVAYTQVEQYIKEDKVLADPLQVSKLIQALFDTKINPEFANIKAKLVYNDAIRGFSKIVDSLIKIKEMYDKQKEDFGIKNDNLKVLYRTLHNNLLMGGARIKEKAKYFEQNRDKIIKALQEEISNIMNEYEEKRKIQPKYADEDVNKLIKRGLDKPEKVRELVDAIITRVKADDVSKFDLTVRLLLERNPIEVDVQKDDQDREAERIKSVKISDTEDFKFYEIPDKIKLVRIPHQQKDANFNLPNVFDKITRIDDNKKLFTTSKKDIDKKLQKYATDLGEKDIVSAVEQRKSLGATDVFNKIMKTIMDETDFSGGIPEISLYGDPYESSINNLRTFYRDYVEYLDLLKQNRIKINEFINFVKSIQEDLIEDLIRLNTLKNKRVKKSDVNNLFTILYKSKDNEEAIKATEKIFDLMNNTIKSYRDLEEVDPIDYFSKYPGTNNQRKPFISNIKGYDPLQWYNIKDPYNKTTRFFSPSEEELIKAILETRKNSMGGVSAQGVRDIYLDFITIIRLLINGQLKRKVGDKLIPIQSLDDLSPNSMIKLLNEYRADINRQFLQYRIEKRKESRKIASVKSSEKREKEKEYGERKYSQSEIRAFKKQRKELDKIIYIAKSQDLSKLLSDYFRADYIEQNKVTKEVELDELKQFYEQYYRIIKIKSSFNNITPDIFKKPENDSEIKEILFKIFKNRYMSDGDINLARSIFKENKSSQFFNIKFFIKDFLAYKKKKIDDIGTRYLTDLNLIDLPYEIKGDKKETLVDDKSITYFLKKVFPKAPAPTAKEIEIAKLVFDQNDPPEKEYEGKIDLTFFKLTYSYLLSLKGSQMELDKINKFKEIAKKQAVADIISPHPTNIYSNVLYLELTDLSKEIKFSKTSTPIDMNLIPSVKDGNSGSYKIFVSKHYLDDFLEKNDYILSSEEKNHLSDKEFLLEGVDINADKKVLVISGDYETVFKPYDGTFSLQDVYKLYSGANTGKFSHMTGDFKSSKTAEEVMDLWNKSRVKVTKLERASMKLSQKISGQKVDKITYVEDDFYKNSKKVLDLFEKNIKIMITTLPDVPTRNIKAKKSDLQNFKDKIENEIDKYKKLITEYAKDLNELFGPTKLEKIQSKIKDQANSTLGLFFKFYDSYIYSFIKTITELIKKKNRYYLNIKDISEKRYEILFNSDDKFKYKGVNSASYESKIKIINDFLEDYSNFSISSAEFILLDVEDIQKKFVLAQEEMEDLISLIENDVSDEQVISTNTADIELEHSIQKIILSKAVFIENIETGYKKVEIMKPNKFSILYDIKSKYEIK